MVKERGELERTIIVVSSDHGEMLGDRGRWGKGVWFEESIRVPLIIAGPEIRSGARSDALVEIQDLCPTFLDYAGAEAIAGIDSASLRPLLEGTRSRHRSHVETALNGWWTVYDGRYKLVASTGGEMSLFDLQTDPLEANDIIADHAGISRELYDAKGAGRGYSLWQ